jgi:hypothetical protein
MATATVAQPARPINPLHLALLASFEQAHAADPAALRAAGRVREHLAKAPAYEFDGVELRISSSSRGRAVQHVTDGAYCNCEGAKHPWCIHRVEFRIFSAEWSLTQPTTLRAKIAEQTEPAQPAQFDDVTGYAYDDYGDIVGVAVSLPAPKPTRSYTQILDDCDDLFN